jgi:chaperonin GroES
MKNWQADSLFNQLYLPTKPINCQEFHFLRFWALWYKIGLVSPAIRNYLTKNKKSKHMAKKLNVTPLHDRVIVRPAKAEEKTAGGIIIPDTAKEKPQRGTVVAAGPGKKDEPVTVKIGDTVLYGKYSGTELTVEGEELLIMRESDILAIV